MASALPVLAPLLVAIGAVPGAWLRYRIVNRLEPHLPDRHWGTLGVNLLACFLLGLLVGVVPLAGAGAAPLLLLLATGFLGSLSTFSSFIAEWYATLRRRPQGGSWRQPWLLVGASLLLGLLALQLGLSWGETLAGGSFTPAGVGR